MKNNKVIQATKLQEENQRAKTEIFKCLTGRNNSLEITAEDETIWEQRVSSEHTNFPNEGNKDARRPQGCHEDSPVQSKTQRKKRRRERENMSVVSCFFWQQEASELHLFFHFPLLVVLLDLKLQTSSKFYLLPWYFCIKHRKVRL